MREKIIEEAVEFIKNQGVNGFSFRTLAEKCSIKSSSVHYHFPTKTDLFVTILTEIKKAEEKALQEMTASMESPRERLEKYVELFIKWIKEGGNKKGSTVMMIGHELSASEPAIRTLTDSLIGLHTDWIAATVVEGKKKGEFKDEVAQDEFASFLMLTLEGGAAVSRATCSFGALDKAAVYLGEIIDSLG